MRVLQNREEGFLEHFKKMQQDILLFNTLAGNDVDNKELIPLYEGLLLEECNELYDAKDVYDIADHQIDVAVIGDFLARLYGFTDGILSGQGITGAGNIHDIYNDNDHLVFLIKQGCKSPLQILDALQISVMNFRDSYVPHEKLMNEIMESNLSKFIPSHAISVEEAESICKNIEEETIYKGVDFKMINGYYVFIDSKGKVMKRHNWFKDVDLTKHY